MEMLQQVEEKFLKIVQLTFDSYNLLYLAPLQNVKSMDLHKIRQLINILRAYHCAALHNEKSSTINDSRRRTFDDFHYNIITMIKIHSPDHQIGKVPFDFALVNQNIMTITNTAVEIMRILVSINLKQNFYHRVNIYNHCLKAVAFNCPFFHCSTPRPFIRRTAELEYRFAELHKRIFDLSMSFKDQPHAFHTDREPRPHPDFTQL